MNNKIVQTKLKIAEFFNKLILFRKCDYCGSWRVYWNRIHYQGKRLPEHWVHSCFSCYQDAWSKDRITSGIPHWLLKLFV